MPPDATVRSQLCAKTWKQSSSKMKSDAALLVLSPKILGLIRWIERRR
jgi:hypothetical protein